MNRSLLWTSLLAGALAVGAGACSREDNTRSTMPSSANPQQNNSEEVQPVRGEDQEQNQQTPDQNQQDQNQQQNQTPNPAPSPPPSDSNMNNMPGGSGSGVPRT